MENEQIYSNLVKILESNGYMLQDSDSQKNLIELDSLQYISFIADVEEAFEIIIPDDFLLQAGSLSIADFYNLITNGLETFED